MQSFKVTFENGKHVIVSEETMVDAITTAVLLVSFTHYGSPVKCEIV